MITITMDDSPERLALAHELMEAEGLALGQALDAAALLEADLMAYAVSYDHHRIRERIRDAVYSACWDADAAAGRIAVEAQP